MDSASHSGMRPKALDVRQLLRNRDNCTLSRHPSGQCMLELLEKAQYNTYVRSAQSAVCATNLRACQRAAAVNIEGVKAGQLAFGACCR